METVKSCVTCRWEPEWNERGTARKCKASVPEYYAKENDVKLEKKGKEVVFVVRSGDDGPYSLDDCPA